MWVTIKSTFNRITKPKTILVTVCVSSIVIGNVGECWLSWITDQQLQLLCLSAQLEVIPQISVSFITKVLLRTSVLPGLVMVLIKTHTLLLNH